MGLVDHEIRFSRLIDVDRLAMRPNAERGAKT